jgi:hypothetical protein
MTQKDLDQDPFSMIKKFFAKKPEIRVGDVGIYQDVLTVDTINDGTHSLKYDIYIKVSAKAVYENLIEIDVIDVFTLNASNTDVKTLIEANIPKYIKPKYIKWEVKK